MAHSAVKGNGLGRALVPPSVNDSLLARFQYNLFGVFHSMADSSAAKHPATATQLIILLLALLDFSQVLHLVVHDIFGWPSFMTWFHNLSITFYIIPDGAVAWFDLAFTSTAIIVLLAAMNAIFIGYCFKTNTWPVLWPLRLLNLVVQLLVTAAFVPMLTILATPFSCEFMALHLDSASDCWGAKHVGFLIVGIACCLLVVPFAIAASLLSHPNDATSPYVDARVSGRASGLATAGRAAMVLAVSLASEKPLLVAIVFIVAQGLVLRSLLTALPYYRRWMNRFTSAMHGTLLFLSLCSLVVAAVPHSAIETVAIVAMAAALPAACLAAWAPSIKYRATARLLDTALGPMRKYMHAKHGGAAAATAEVANLVLKQSSNNLWELATGEGGKRRAAPGRSPRAAMPAMRARLAQAMARTSQDAAELGLQQQHAPARSSQQAQHAAHGAGIDPFSDISVAQRMEAIADLTQHVSSTGYQPRMASFAATEAATKSLIHASEESGTLLRNASVADVELMARVLMERPGFVQQKARKWWLRPMPSQDAVEKAVWLFAAGADEFKHTPSEIAAMKIAFASFVQAYTQDVNLATVALEGAHGENPSWEGAFEVFSRSRALQQMRQARNVGAGAMNAVATVEFHARLASALRQHGKAVRGISQALRAITRFTVKKSKTRSNAKVRTRLSPSEASVVGHFLGRSISAADVAHAGYKRLLSSNSVASAQLLASYNNFVTDVLGRPDMSMQSNRASSGGASVSGRSSGGGQSVNDGDRSSVGTHATKSREYVPQDRTRSITRLQRQVKCLVLTLLVYFLAFGGLTMFFVNKGHSATMWLHEAGNHRDELVLATTGARNLYLHALNVQQQPGSQHAAAAFNATAQLAAEDMLHLHDGVRELRFQGPLTDHLLELWQQTRVPVRTLLVPADAAAGTPDVYRNDSLNLLDLLGAVTAFTNELARTDAATLAHAPTTLPAWRYVMENTLQQVLPLYEELVDAFHERVEAIPGLYFYVTLPIICLALLSMAALAFFITIKSRASVANVQHVLTSVVAAIEVPVLNRLARHYRATTKRVRALQQAAHASANGSPMDDVAGVDSNDEMAESSDSGSDESDDFDDTVASPQDANVDLIAPPGLVDGAAREAAAPQPGVPAHGGEAEEGALSRFDSASVLPGFGGVALDDGAGGAAAAAGAAGAAAAAGAAGAAGAAAAAGAGGTGAHDGAVAEEVVERSPADQEADKLAATVTMVNGRAFQRRPIPVPGILREQLLESQDAAMVIINVDALIVAVNSRVLELTGYLEHELVGQNVRKIVPKEYRKRHNGFVTHAAEGGTPRICGLGGRELPLVTKSGSQLPVYLSINKMEDGTGAMYFIGSLVVFRRGKQGVERHADDEEELDTVAASSSYSAQIRVALALLILALGQLVTWWEANNSMTVALQHANEVRMSGRVVTECEVIMFLSQELLIADEWHGSNVALLHSLTEAEHLLLEHRSTLYYGSADGAIHGVFESEAQDALTFATTPAAWDVSSDTLVTSQQVPLIGTVAAGADKVAIVTTQNSPHTAVEDGQFGAAGLLETFWRVAEELTVRKEYSMRPGKPPLVLGPNITALHMDEHLNFLLRTVSGRLGRNLHEAVSIYDQESAAEVQREYVTHILIGLASAVLVLILYTAVFNGMTRTLMQLAARTELLLNIVPQERIPGSALCNFYHQRGEV